MAQTKLDIVSDAVPKAIQGENISPADFHKMLQRMEKYHNLKKRSDHRTKKKRNKLQRVNKSFFSKEEKKAEKNLQININSLSIQVVNFI